MSDIVLPDTIRVRVLGRDCPECFKALLLECDALGSPLAGTAGIVPAAWLDHSCSHGREGVFLERVDQEDAATDDSDDNQGDLEIQVDVELGRSAATLDDQKWFQQERWRELYPDAIDATKGIGYPAREVGRYGSHPQHDGSDD